MSDAEEIASEISEELDSIDQSASYEGSFKSYRSQDNRMPPKSGYPPIPGKSPAFKQADDYSFSFEGSESNVYNTYSQDFEADESLLPKLTPGHAPAVVSSAVAPTSSGLKLIPSVQLQALEAELSLQQLSEEVIQLRNKQRAALKDRWNKVKEKKKRAEERRMKHVSELNQLQQKVLSLEAEVKNGTVVNTNLTTELKASQSSIATLEAANARLHELCDEKDNEIALLRSDIASNCIKIDELNANMTVHRETMKQDKETYQAEITKRDLQVEVLTRSMESTEARYLLYPEGMIES